MKQKGHKQPQQITKKIQKDKKFDTFAKEQQQKKQKGKEHKHLLIAKAQQKKKSNSFKDPRLKQQVANVRSGINKKSKFDLSSGEEDNVQDNTISANQQKQKSLQLTHRGRKIDEIDDFDDNISSDNDNVPAEVVDQLHFQGFDDENQNQTQEQNIKGNNQKVHQRKKTQKEIYEEIIKKSKLYKHERTKQREENIDLLQTVNESYNDIKSLLSFRDKDSKNQEVWQQKLADNYDKLAQELLYEQKAFPNYVKEGNYEKNKAEHKQKHQKKVVFTGIMSSEEEEQQINDDELQGNEKRERSIMKHYRKVQNLNNFVENLKQIKQKTKNQNKFSEDNDKDYEDDDDDDEDDDEMQQQEGSENQNSEDQGDMDSIDEIDLDEEEEGSGEESGEGEEIQLEDEFESEEEKIDKSEDVYDNQSD